MKNLKLLVGLLLGTVVYRFLTWYEILGVNAFVFAVLLVLLLFLYKPALRNNKLILCMAGALVTSAIGVVLTGLTFSKVVYYITLIVFLAFVQTPVLRSMWNALLLLPVHAGVAVWFDLKLVGDACKELLGKRTKNPNRKSLKAWQVVLIILVALVFLGIFAAANPQFSRLISTVWETVFDFLRWLIPDISFLSIIHFLWIGYFLSLFFLHFKENSLSRDDMREKDDLTRPRTKQYRKYLTMGLRSEYRAALVCMIVINALVLAVNATDIVSVWFGAIPDTARELSNFVHRGTYALVFSVLLSIGMLLFFFRKNLNFYSTKRPLKTIAYIWIVQNAFLICSTGLRNWHYVAEYGLTYKRIGVFVFLLTVCMALLLLFFKIRSKKTIYYYFRMGTFGALAIMVVCGLVNWDILIASYNTQCIEDTDYDYLERLSRQTAPYILLRGKETEKIILGYDVTEESEPVEDYAEVMDNEEEDTCGYYSDTYKSKVNDYIEQVNRRSWKSFNLGDWCAVQKLEKMDVRTD